MIRRVRTPGKGAPAIHTFVDEQLVEELSCVIILSRNAA